MIKKIKEDVRKCSIWTSELYPIFSRNNQNYELFNFNMVNDRFEIFEFFEKYCIEVLESSKNGDFYPILSV